MNNQLDLFGTSSEKETPKARPIAAIEGLTFIENYLTKEEETQLLQAIDDAPWLADLKRRVQHYGYKYDYRARRIDVSMKIGELPIWAKNMAIRLHKEGYFAAIPDQLIVNEYEPGQGISPHIDCAPCFEDTIVSISLNSTAVMDFTHAIRAQKIPIFMPRRSAVVLKKDSRYVWKHSIAARKTDKHNGKIYPRGRRVSLTFRKVIL